MAQPEEHQFNRRFSDGNVAALALRMKAMEDRVEALELNTRIYAGKLEENTDLTKEVHGAVYGIEGEVDGLMALTQRHVDRTEAMLGIFEGAKKGLNAVGKVGDGLAWIGERGVKLMIGAAIVGGAIAFARTGEVPDWIFRVFSR